MILRVLSGDDSQEEINRTFNVLIPKVVSLKNLGQFCLIGLFNVIYKIASKVLANMFKIILPDKEFQSHLSTMCFIDRYLEDLEIAAVRVSKSTQISPRVARSAQSGFLSVLLQ